MPRVAITKTVRLMQERGVDAATIRKVVYDNVLAVYGLNGEMRAPAGIDQRTLDEGNSVLRGGQTPAHRTARPSRG